MIILAIFALTFVAANSAQQRVSQEKINLRISVYNVPPFCIITEGPNGTAQYSGYQILYLNWLGEALKANMVYVPVKTQALKTLGLYQATIQQLLDDEVDIANSLLYPSIERSAIMEFTVPVISSRYSMVLPYPREKNRLGAVIGPFKYEVWILQIITLFAVAFVIFKLSSWRSTNTKFDLGNSFIYVYTVLVNQGNFIPYSYGAKVRLVAGLWCLVILVMANAYSGSLTSYMTAVEVEPIPQSFQEFVAMKKYSKVAVEKNTVLTNLFLNATSGNYKIIGDMLRQHPNLMVGTNQSNVIDSVLQHGAVFITGEEFSKIIIYSDMNKTGTCRMTMANFMAVSSSYLRFGLQKRGRYNEIINSKMWYAWEYGLKSIWGRPFMNPIDKCEVTNKRISVIRNKIVPLSLKELFSVFLILAVGFGASGIVFIFELICYKLRNKKVTQM